MAHKFGNCGKVNLSNYYKCEDNLQTKQNKHEKAHLKQLPKSALHNNSSGMQESRKLKLQDQTRKSGVVQNDGAHSTTPENDTQPKFFIEYIETFIFQDWKANSIRGKHLQLKVI